MNTGVKFLLFFYFLFVSDHISGQNQENQDLRDVLYFADIMMNADENKHKQRAAEVFYPLFLKLLSLDNSYQKEYHELKWISKKYSEDRSFRIFTWYVPVNREENRYYGILQTTNGKLYELKDGFKTTDELESETEEYDNNLWLGAMYYNVIDVQGEDGDKYYLLFGVNKWNEVENLKIADVLFFTKAGEPVFGKEVFYRKDKNGTLTKLNRLIIKYSADAMVSLNYNPGLEMIVMDHLIPRMSRLKSDDTVMVPDGSYSGYVLKNGVWEYIDKLHTELLDEAPRPAPVLDSRKNKTIFGNGKKKQ